MLTFLTDIVNGTIAQTTSPTWLTEEVGPVEASRRSNSEPDGGSGPLLPLATAAAAFMEPPARVRRQNLPFLFASSWAEKNFAHVRQNWCKCWVKRLLMLPEKSWNGHSRNWSKAAEQAFTIWSSYLLWKNMASRRSSIMALDFSDFLALSCRDPIYRWWSPTTSSSWRTFFFQLRAWFSVKWRTSARPSLLACLNKVTSYRRAFNRTDGSVATRRVESQPSSAWADLWCANPFPSNEHKLRWYKKTSWAWPPLPTCYFVSHLIYSQELGNVPGKPLPKERYLAHTDGPGWEWLPKMARK